MSRNYAPPPPSSSPPFAPTTKMAVQGRRSGGGVPGLLVEYRCSKCAIVYSVPEGDRANCPLCRAERDLATMRIALQDAMEKLRNVEEAQRGLIAEVDQVNAMKNAMAIIGDDDRAWLKSVLYRYREDNRLSLVVMSSRGTRSRTAVHRSTPSRFLLTAPSRENEEYLPTSPGGVAILGYFEEVTREFGAAKAMRYLLRALGQTLTGGEVR